MKFYGGNARKGHSGQNEEQGGGMKTGNLLLTGNMSGWNIRRKKRGSGDNVETLFFQPKMGFLPAKWAYK